MRTKITNVLIHPTPRKIYLPPPSGTHISPLVGTFCGYTEACLYVDHVSLTFIPPHPHIHIIFTTLLALGIYCLLITTYKLRWRNATSHKIGFDKSKLWRRFCVTANEITAFSEGSFNSPSIPLQSYSPTWSAEGNIKTCIKNLETRISETSSAGLLE